MSSLPELQRIVRDFPTVVADSAEFTSYTGFVRVRDQHYRVRVRSDPAARERVHGDAPLVDAVARASDAAKRRLASARDAHAVLIELRDIVERHESLQRTASSATSGISSDGGYGHLPPASFYESLLAEIDTIGWSTVEDLSDDMRTIRLQVEDAARRVHTVSVTVPYEYPKIAPTVVPALPSSFVLSWSETSNLQTVLEQLSGEVGKFQAFFDVMDDFDEKCWVIEPEHPLRSDLYRRIALGNHCSIRLEVDPRAPLRAVPECRFLGSDAAVGPLRDRLNMNMSTWDTSGRLTPRENLEAMLEIKLPAPPSEDTAEADDARVECGVCYAYRLGDSAPDVACERLECAKPFHRTCLAAWLRGLPDTKQSFDVLIGSCPYCEHTIRVPASTV